MVIPLDDNCVTGVGLRAARRASDCCRHAVGSGGQARLPMIAQGLYLNSGRLFSESLVAPGSTIFLSFTTSELKGTTTYFVPMPRKPPTDSTAKGTVSLGVTIRSSIVPTASLASL